MDYVAPLTDGQAGDLIDRIREIEGLKITAKFAIPVLLGADSFRALALTIYAEKTTDGCAAASGWFSRLMGYACVIDHAHLEGIVDEFRRDASLHFQEDTPEAFVTFASYHLQKNFHRNDMHWHFILDAPGLADRPGAEMAENGLYGIFVEDPAIIHPGRQRRAIATITKEIPDFGRPYYTFWSECPIGLPSKERAAAVLPHRMVMSIPPGNLYRRRFWDLLKEMNIKRYTDSDSSRRMEITWI